jgi:hypothetical protein
VTPVWNARSLLATTAVLGTLALLPAAADADAGHALLEIGRLSNGAPTVVAPSSQLAGLNYDEGAGGRFGALVGLPGDSRTFTFTPPADATVDAGRVWPSMYLYGWPGVATWGEVISSWGSWNLWGDPGEVRIDGLWSQGGSGMVTGAAPALSVTVRQQTLGGDALAPAHFLADKLDITLADALPPEIGEQPDPGAPLGSPRPSGWYTGASAPLTMTVGDRGLGVRALLVRDGADVHRYTPAGLPASCSTKDPDPALLGGDTYTARVPCPTAGRELTATVDLSDLGDGTHSLSFGVRDAAGNVRWSPTAYTVRTNGNGGALADPGTACPNGTVDDSGTCIAMPPVNTSPPALVGFAGPIAQGQTVYTDNGAWDRIDGVAWSYDWELCDADGTGCEALSDTAPAPADPTTAAGDHVSLGADSVGRRLRSIVTATTNGGAGTARSALSDPIAPMVPVNTAAPVLTGLAQVGQALTTTTGAWTNTTSVRPLPVIGWQRCDAGGGGCADIAGAAGSTYTLTGADLAHTVRSRVRLINSGGGSATASSSPSPIVFPAGAGGNGGAGSVSAVEPARAPGGGGSGNGGGAVVEADEPALPVPDPPAGVPVERINGNNPGGRVVGLTARLTHRGVLRSGQPGIIAGRLTTRDGHPVAGARIDVVSHLWMTGARGEIAGSVTTDAEGNFRFTVKAGPSRIITLGYRMHLADRTYTATAAVKVHVRPVLTLEADRSNVANGDLVRLSGRVEEAPAGSRKLVELQALVQDRWVTFATTRMADGRITHRHRFTNTRGTRTYLLRARAGAEATWPFRTSVSRPVRITVSGPGHRRAQEDHR